MHHHSNKNCTNKGKSRSPKTIDILKQKVTEKEEGVRLVMLPNQSVSEDMEASYPDLGSLKDSREGGPDESEEVEEGAGERGWDSSFGGAPLPKHLGQVSGNCCSIASWWGPICQYQVLMEISMTVVLVRVVQSPWAVQSPLSVPWFSVHFCHDL